MLSRINIYIVGLFAPTCEHFTRLNNLQSFLITNMRKEGLRQTITLLTFVLYNPTKRSQDHSNTHYHARCYVTSSALLFILDSLILKNTNNNCSQVWFKNDKEAIIFPPLTNSTETTWNYFSNNLDNILKICYLV